MMSSTTSILHCPFQSTALRYIWKNSKIIGALLTTKKYRSLFDLHLYDVIKFRQCIAMDIIVYVLNHRWIINTPWQILCQLHSVLLLHAIPQYMMYYSNYWMINNHIHACRMRCFAFLYCHARPFFVTSFDADNMSCRRVKFVCDSSITHHATK